ncbi:cell surface glycoprotein [Methanoplanus limicola DSM 2279]|uniref:Cell surface glycoprotein n=1 Tax=Methanoplanus limicola DSM 2279 TaxID=937775 RepID=H1Z422_9EURY|nr:cell surface glycoprotein [Methanoplanus limicola DSM 2279]
MNLIKYEAVILILISFAAASSATYAGDNPITTVYNEKINGGYIFSTGNSTYSGQLNPDDSYSVSFDTALPENSEVKFSRAYVYWGWSKNGQSAVYPDISLSRTDEITGDISTDNSGDIAAELNKVSEYTDSKGFVSSNDFFSGVYAFETGDITPGINKFILTAENTGDNESTFVIQGIGILAVYEDPSGKTGTIWINEGCDMLSATYGITPEMATGTAFFEGNIEKSRVNSAKMHLIAPSGGYTRTDTPEKNAVYFNRKDENKMPGFFESILLMLFPGYNGKTWTDAFDSDEIQQIGIDTRDVTPWLKESGNFVKVRDQGDYMLFTNAILFTEEET